MSTLPHIAFFAIFGIATRGLLNWGFAFGPDDPVLFTDLPANMLGCFLMGLFSKSNRLSRWPSNIRTGLTTGYCGSLTTFSGWIVATVTRFLRCNDAWCVLMVLYSLLGAWAIYDLCFRGGEILATATDEAWLPGEVERAKVNSLADSWLYSNVVVMGGLLALLSVSAFWVGFTNWSLPAAVLWAPVGAGLRTLLGRSLGWKGTMVANWLGTAISCSGVIMWEITRPRLEIRILMTGDRPWQSVFAASVSIGLAGSLSTASTFVAEARNKLTPHVAIAYVLTTVCGGLAIAFAMLWWFVPGAP